MKKYYTDYPFTELGDIEFKKAPIRVIEKIETWDTDKYVGIIVEGISKEIKAGYIYTKPGRVGEVPKIPLKELEKYPKPTY